MKAERQIMKTAILCVFLLTIGLGAISVSAQQPDMNAILKRTNELRAAGSYDAALAEAQKLESAVKAQFGTDHANYALALATLAEVYSSQAKYAEAEGLYQRTLGIYEKALGADHPDVAYTLIGFGNVYYAQGKHVD